MTTWIQCSKTGKMIRKEEYYQYEQSIHMIQEDIKPFVSPIDGSVIGSRSDLRVHNQRHGVTDPRDYGPEYFKRKKRDREDDLSCSSRDHRRDRINSIQEAIYRNGG